MSDGSPTAYLLWAILSTTFFIFLIIHLWLYDRFNCVKWDSGRQPGAFRRVMTYSYLGTVPLLVVFSTILTLIKFQEGYILSPTFGIIPNPLHLWTAEHRRWLLPLNFLFSVAWALELVTHLEELAFWLFLLHQGPEKRFWFDSWEFKTWYLGSMLAVIGMPLTAVVARRELERTQAWILLVGSIAGTLTTIAFLYIIFRFPAFIQQVKLGGAEPDVVVRLATFYNFNSIRVVFRFLFTIPLLTIGVDALCPPYNVILNPFALDFLLMIGGIGCFISSALTLLVFFPRSITRESGYTTNIPSPQSGKAPRSSLPNCYHGPHAEHPTHHLLHGGGSAYDYETSAMTVYTHFHPSSPNSPSYHSRPYQPTVDTRQPHLRSFMRSSRELSYDETMPRESESLSRVQGEETESLPEDESELYELSSENIPSLRSSSYPMRLEPSLREEGLSQPEYYSFGHPVRQDSADTAVSQPNSGATMFEEQPSVTPAGQETPSGNRDSHAESGIGGFSELPSPPLPVLSRRHSDSPYDSRTRRVVSNSGILPMSEDGHLQRLHQRRSGHCDIAIRMQENTGPVLHPYLMNWTSPIDLLDTLPSRQPSPMD